MTIDQKIENLCKKYKVSLFRFDFPNNWNGRGDYLNSKIGIHKRIKNKHMILSLFLHELGHIYCHRNNLWRNHHPTSYENASKCVSKRKRIAYKAERWVENWAKNEFTKLRYNPNKYYCFYKGDKQSRKWLKDHFLKHLK